VYQHFILTFFTVYVHFHRAKQHAHTIHDLFTNRNYNCTSVPCSSNILLNLRFYKVHNISTTLEDNIKVLINKIEI